MQVRGSSNSSSPRLRWRSIQAARLPPVRAIRRVPMAHAAAWYSDAMRLWKRGPAIFTALALVMLACNLALNLVPMFTGLATHGARPWFPLAYLVTLVLLAPFSAAAVVASMAQSSDEPVNTCSISAIMAASAPGKSTGTSRSRTSTCPCA